MVGSIITFSYMFVMYLGHSHLPWPSCALLLLIFPAVLLVTFLSIYLIRVIYRAWSLSFFSIAVTKHHDQSTLEKGEFIWAYGSRGVRSHHG